MSRAEIGSHRKPYTGTTPLPPAWVEPSGSNGDTHDEEHDERDDGDAAGRPWPQLDPAALHGLAGEIVRTIEPETEADPAALLFGILTYAGAVIGAGPHAFADGARHPARLFTIIVGKTAQARKGSAANQVRNLFRVADPDFIRERVMTGFGSGEALIDAVAQCDDKIYDPRLLIREGEYARILKTASRDGSSLSAIIRCAWDGDRLAVRSRVRTSVADNAHIAVQGDITAEELRKCLTEVEQLNGAANRPLYVCARRSKLLPEGGNLDDAALTPIGRRLRAVLEAASGIGRLARTDDGRKVWGHLYAELAADDPGGLLGAITARGQAQCLRLSVAYALLDGSRAIDVVHIDAARAAWAYCRGSAQWIFGDAIGDEIADRLLAALRRARTHGLDRTQIDDLFAGHRGAEVARARQMLVQRGLAVETVEPTAGRPRIVLRIAEKAGKEEKPR